MKLQQKEVTKYIDIETNGAKVMAGQTLGTLA